CLRTSPTGSERRAAGPGNFDGQVAKPDVGIAKAVHHLASPGFAPLRGLGLARGARLILGGGLTSIGEALPSAPFPDASVGSLPGCGWTRRTRERHRNVLRRPLSSRRS